MYASCGALAGSRNSSVNVTGGVSLTADPTSNVHSNSELCPLQNGKLKGVVGLINIISKCWCFIYIGFFCKLPSL